jgi:hypothetical protein
VGVAFLPDEKAALDGVTLAPPLYIERGPEGMDLVTPFIRSVFADPMRAISQQR